MRCTLLTAVVVLGQVTAMAEHWDIADTGQPRHTATLTLEEGTWMSVDVSPNGETLVFDLLGDIFSMPAVGGDAVLVHGGPALQRNPRFSPDGTRLLYISDANGADNIWISRFDGADARRVSSETEDRITTPAWSADGDYIAATRVVTTVTEGLFSDIKLYHVGGGGGRVLVEKTPARKSVEEAAFSRDGKWLYYTESMPLAAAPNLADPNQPGVAVRRRDLTSGETETVAGGYGGASSAQVSPNGDRFAFVRRVMEKSVLFVRDLETGVETPVYDALSRDARVSLGMKADTGYYPQFAWFPDNRSIAIWAQGKIRRIDVDAAGAIDIPFRATADHAITDALRFGWDLAPESFKVQSIRGVSTSADGNSIVFSALGDIWRMSLSGDETRRLTNTSTFDYDPTFSADGKQILFVSWDDERGSAIRSMSTSGKRAHTIFETTGVVRRPVLSKAGDTIAFFIDKPNDLMGGYRVQAGVYWIPSMGGEATFVSSGRFPSFSQDGQRLRYLEEKAGGWGVVQVQELRSKRLDGLDERILISSIGSARGFRLSPDEKWLAFEQDQNIYVMPYAAIGAALIADAGPAAPAVAMRITETGGWDYNWSADGRRIHYMFGDEYFSIDASDLSASGGSDEFVPPSKVVNVNVTAVGDLPIGVIAFTNARVITMDGDEIIECGSVIVEGNRIAAVGADVVIPAGAKQIDVSGKTIVPGLIDMHGHLTMYRQGPSPQKHAAYYAALAFGITTNFDPSSADHTTATNMEMLKAGLMVGPRYIGTGQIIYGYRGASAKVALSTIEDARAVMRRKKEIGLYTLKSYMQPMRSQRQRLVKAAREAEMMVMPEGEGRFYSQLTMVLDGHTTIEHNNPVGVLYDDVVQLIANSETAITPTLIVTTGDVFGENLWFQKTRPWTDPKVRAYVHNTMSSYNPLGGGISQPPYARGMVSIHIDDDLWEKGVIDTARSIKRLHDAGVLVNAGSHGQIDGLGMHWEMWLMHLGGMEPLDVLHAATINPAKTLGIDHQVGSISPGKLADLIVLDANPLDDIYNTNTVRFTMVNGRLYDSLSMDEIGNYDRPRSRFFWELPDYNGIDWNETWQGDDMSRFQGHSLH